MCPLIRLSCLVDAKLELSLLELWLNKETSRMTNSFEEVSVAKAEKSWEGEQGVGPLYTLESDQAVC